MRVLIMPSAEADLVDIADWIGRDSKQRAIGFAIELRDQCLGLADNPYRFPRLGHRLARDLRKFSYRDYLILYRVVGERVEIMRISHGSRSLSKLVR